MMKHHFFSIKIKDYFYHETKTQILKSIRIKQNCKHNESHAKKKHMTLTMWAHM